MGEKEDKEKAEKVAAAKKRVAALQKKKKAAAAGGEKLGSKSKDKAAKEDALKSPVKEEAVEPAEEHPEIETETKHTAEDDNLFDQDDAADEDEAAFNDAVQSASQPDDAVAVMSSEADTSTSPDQANEPSTPSTSRHSGRQASISLQSQLRSTSFRTTAPGPISPSTGSLQRIEELERENKRLAEDAAEHQSRWQKSEEELEELRLKSTNKDASETDALRTEIETLKRSQRQNPAMSGNDRSSRRESSTTTLAPDHASLLKELESKESTIADMQLEISRLRSEVSSQNAGCETHGEQISSLQSNLSSTESKLRGVQSELTDTKKSLTRALEKAVMDSTERTSKDTKIRNLERDSAALTTQRDDLSKKTEQLQQKIDAMSKLHRETESRSNSKVSSLEQQAREIPALRAKTTTLEADNARLREKHKRAMSGADASANQDIDELEDEGRKKLELRIRELEGEVFEFRRGVWRDKRTALQPDISEGARSSFEQQAAADGEGFDEVDLSGGRSRRASSFMSRTKSPSQPKHSNLSQYLSSGINAFLPSTASPPPPSAAGGGSGGGGSGRQMNNSLLQDFEDEGGFDEAAFALAQREEEARKMLEHVREVKRGLKQWKGWRLDLVDSRRGEGGWEIFEI